jgi:hypothetical protein
MGVTIEQLNEKYRTEDDPWDFSLFRGWLANKGISEQVIDVTLKQALIDFDLETLPEKHRTFDHLVLLRALISKLKTQQLMDSQLETEAHESVNNAIKKYDADWYKLKWYQKIWLIIIGKD